MKKKPLWLRLWSRIRPDIEWQLYPSWGFQYETTLEEHYGATRYWLIIGPLQMRWWGK